MSGDLDFINPRLLPPLTRRFINVIGLDETIKLLKALGGTRIRIPVNPDKSVALKGVISDDAIEKLSDAMPDERFDLPKADKALNQLRDLSIHIHRRDGHASAPQLALKHNLTRRQIINIDNKMKERVAERDLFDGIDTITD